MIFWKRLWLHGLQQKGVQMFNKEHLDKIDRNYFNVIIADDRNVTLQSRNENKCQHCKHCIAKFYNGCIMCDVLSSKKGSQ